MPTNFCDSQWVDSCVLADSHSWPYQKVNVAIVYNFQFAAVQVWFDPQNYTVTEGDEVAITLVTSTRHSETDFTVILQYIDGSATGESCSIHDLYIHTYSLSLCLSSSLLLQIYTP